MEFTDGRTPTLKLLTDAVREIVAERETELRAIRDLGDWSQPKPESVGLTMARTAIERLDAEQNRSVRDTERADVRAFMAAAEHAIDSVGIGNVIEALARSCLTRSQDAGAMAEYWQAVASKLRSARSGLICDERSEAS